MSRDREEAVARDVVFQAYLLPPALKGFQYDDLVAKIAAALFRARREGREEMRERAARVADEEAHGYAFAAGSIGIGGGSREHATLSAQAEAARGVGVGVRALSVEDDDGKD